MRDWLDLGGELVLSYFDEARYARDTNDRDDHRRHSRPGFSGLLPERSRRRPRLAGLLDAIGRR